MTLRVAIVLLTCASAQTAPPSVTDEQVDLAIGRAVQYLWSRQDEAGQWHDARFDRMYPGGMTCLAAFALRTAGAGIGDVRLQKAVNVLLETEGDIRSVYGRSFRLMLWASLDPQKYRKPFKADVRFLTGLQNRHGAWGYGHVGVRVIPRDWSDASNSQLAILALWTANQFGGEVGRKIWERAEESWLQSQREDGGWGYMPRTNPFRATGGLRPDSYGSMTAAGLATLYILYDQLYSRSAGRFDGRRSRNCRYNLPQSGELRQAMDDAWMWLNTRFTTDAIPEFPGGRQTLFRSQWLNYYLYSVERAGVASGFKTFGSNNWYRDLANQLVRTQQGNGSWGTIDQTCFGLLALVKGRTPVVINKLRHGEQTDWNNTPRDAATLTRWLSRQLERPMTWQIVDLDSPEADIKDAPILYLTGHKSPKFSDLEKDLLRDYVLSGGTVLAVACCSRASFARGVSTLFEEVFPRYRRQVLSKNHALWTLQYRINPDDSVTGFSDGCRTRLFVVQRGLNNAWHQNLFADYRDMFRLGANLLLYATNRQDPRSVAPAMGRGRIAGLGPAHGADADRRRGAHRIRVGRVGHDGDGWTDPNALTRLSDVLLDGFDLVISETPAVDLRYADLDRFDLLWLTGHHLPPPDSDALKRLKAYLEGGGTLLATGCCGRSGFDAVFGAWMEHAFGLDALIDVPADDPLITGRLAPSSDVDVWGPLGSDLTHPRLKRPRLDPDGPAWPSKLAVPLLKGVQLRPDLNAPRRWAVIYSPLDIHCGLSGHFCVNCKGYQPQDARAIAVNAVLYTYLSKERPGG